MSDRDNANDGSLVPARRDLVPVAAGNPLVSRGIADLAKARLPKASDGGRLATEKAILCHVLGNDCDESICLFNKSILLNPSNSFAYLLRGGAWFRKSRADSDNEACDKAIHDFDQAIRLEPEYTSAYRQRGLAWYFKKDYDKAIRDFDEAIKLSSTAEVDDSDDENDAGLDEAIRRSTAELYYCRGKTWALKTNFDKAVQDFDEAIRLDPENPLFSIDRKNAWHDKKD
jgi:tetratricopeptide (TPR) repeat protein